MKNLCYFLFVILTFAGCNEKPESSKMYFDFDGLIDSQLNQLTDMNASIKKVAELGVHQDDSVFRPDSLGWANELEIFRSLDVINKPINANVYEVVDGISDNRSNLTIKSYRAKTKAQVSELHFYYQDSFDKLRRIEAVTNVSTTLYSNSRSLTMEFDQHNSDIILTGYAIEGKQKMILSDSAEFKVSVKVIL